MHNKLGINQASKLILLDNTVSIVDILAKGPLALSFLCPLT
jgi:hypothetical protein